MSTHPEHILVAGDWHGNTPWALGVIGLLDTLLPNESPKLILHLGDFGIWPGRGGARYVDEVNRDLIAADAHLSFVDGNHENFDELADLAQSVSPVDPVPVHTNITWLPRGHRWTWHGRRWLAVGGAVSVDRAHRRERVDWWPEEEISEAQTQDIACGGRADVMVCHDAPCTVPLRLAAPQRDWAAADLARADAHRERLQDITDAVEPSHLFHGHYHVAHETAVAMLHGPVAVTGLDRDDSLFNFKVVDVRNMREPGPRIASGKG